MGFMLFRARGVLTAAARRPVPQRSPRSRPFSVTFSVGFGDDGAVQVRLTQSGGAEKRPRDDDDDGGGGARKRRDDTEHFANPAAASSSSDDDDDEAVGPAETFEEAAAGTTAAADTFEAALHEALDALDDALGQNGSGVLPMLSNGLELASMVTDLASVVHPTAETARYLANRPWRESSAEAPSNAASELDRTNRLSHVPAGTEKRGFGETVAVVAKSASRVAARHAWESDIMQHEVMPIALKAVPAMKSAHDFFYDDDDDDGDDDGDDDDDDDDDGDELARPGHIKIQVDSTHVRSIPFTSDRFHSRSIDRFHSRSIRFDSIYDSGCVRVSTGALLGACHEMSIIDSETAITIICCFARSSGVPSSCPRI